MKNRLLLRILERLGSAEPRIAKGFGSSHVKRSRATGKNLGTITYDSDESEDSFQKSTSVKISRAFLNSKDIKNKHI
tara:strand:- start:388 stop:618 length:231 start_codon:yes stop_codon:yes gene_type:complete